MRTILISLLAFAAALAFAQDEATAPNSASPDGVAEVSWNLTNEQFVSEFRVFRGESAEGPWTQITAMPGLGPGLHGPQSYRHLDHGLEIGRRYHYLVECEFTDAEVMRTPTISFVATESASGEVMAVASGEITASTPE